MLQSLAYKTLSGLGVSEAWRRIRPPRGIVFMCHSVANELPESFAPNSKWRISSAQLGLAIECAREMGYRAASMDTLAQGLGAPADTAPYFAMTFDDGYLDNLTTALPVCRRAGVPMIVYATTGFISGTHTAWWHVLEHLLASQDRADIALPGGQCAFACRTDQEKRQAYHAISRQLTGASSLATSSFVASVAERYGSGSLDYAQSLFMNEAQLHKLAEDDLATVGAHGVSHDSFAALEPDQLTAQLNDSRQYLTDATGSAPRHIAYPFGSKPTADVREYDAARNAGFMTGVTTRHGCITATIHDPLALPRIPIFPTDTAASLRCKLSGITTAAAHLRRTGV